MKNHISKIFSLLFFSIIINSSSYPQSITIKGKITSISSKSPVQYANVVIPGTTIGTISDENGKFTLEYPDSLKKNYDLLISAIGYKRYRTPLKSIHKNLNVKLQDSLFLLDEVKTIAYNYFIPLKWQNKRNKKEEYLLTFAARDKGTIDNFLKVFKEYHRKSKKKTNFLYVWKKVNIPNVNEKIKIILAILPCTYCPIEGALTVTMLIKGSKSGNLMNSKEYKDIIIKHFQSILDKSMKQGISMELLVRKGKTAFLDDKPYTGKCFKYYKSGQKGIAGEYLEGKKHGKWEYWYSDGKQKLVGYFNQGVKNGEWKLWYPNGQIKMIVNYKNGKMDGKNIWWHENGKKKKEAIFDNGKFINKKEWDEKGNLIIKSF